MKALNVVWLDKAAGPLGLQRGEQLVRFLFINLIFVGAEMASGAPTRTIMAGGEFDSPHDAPSLRLDTTGTFSFVGALSITSGVSSFYGSGIALSREWILTAGHNADLNDDGLPDDIWSATFYLPGIGEFVIAEAIAHPDFTGFSNPVVNDDLALLRLAQPLPDTIVFPAFGLSVGVSDQITLVGFGRSGYGSYGYTTNASLTARRSGTNVVDSLELDDEGSGLAEVFRYDFDDPASFGHPFGSLGNNVETIIGPGDSGGPALVLTTSGWNVVGINTFTEGYGGLFGDTGGGILLAPYKDWINNVTAIPEPGTIFLLFASSLVLLGRRSRR